MVFVHGHTSVASSVPWDGRYTCDCRKTAQWLSLEESGRKAWITGQTHMHTYMYITSHIARMATLYYETVLDQLLTGLCTF